jgi:hypothetical protein
VLRCLPRLPPSYIHLSSVSLFENALLDVMGMIFGMDGIPAGPDVADYKCHKQIELALAAGSIAHAST